MKIIIDKSKINEVYKSLSENKESLDSNIMHLNTIIDNIMTIWTGKDQAKLIKVLQEKYVVGLQDLSNILDEYTAYLSNIPKGFDLLDDTFMNKNIDV